MAEQSIEGYLVSPAPDPLTYYESPSHPYVEVGVTPRYALLRAQNGTEFEVTRTVGRTLLSLGVGVENEKTHLDICADLYPDNPGRVVSQRFLKYLLRDARTATIGLGPPIIAERRGRGNDTSFYYEDILRQRLDNFGDRDDNALTRVRFDTRTSCLAISVQGVCQEARINGKITRLILEALLRHPNKDVDCHSLSDAVLALGYHRSVLHNNIDSFRSVMERRFGDNFSPLFTSYIEEKNPERKGWRFYNFSADSIEIIEKDGSKRVYPDESSLESEQDCVSVDDVSLVALSMLTKGARIRKYLPPFLQAKWPQRTDLMALSQAALSGEAAAKQSTRDKTMESLKRVKAFLDRPDIEAYMRNWSPEDGRVKSLVGFLAMFDKIPFTSSSQNRKARGIDVLTDILLNG